MKSSFPFGMYKGKGNNAVEGRKYIGDKTNKEFGRIYINETQFFDNVHEDVWNFFIGGYQVLDKYLKDRKNTNLNLDEIESIEKIIRIISFTNLKMSQIDELTKHWI